MELIRTCKFCGIEYTTVDKRKVFCNKKCADRSRNRVGPAYSAGASPITELKQFGKLTPDARRHVLLGSGDFSVVMFDIEATHLKPNVGRILCCSFKPIGQDIYTFSALDPEYMDADVYNDTALACAIRDELEKYDIIVGWNSKNFDTKYINARALRGGGRTKNPQYQVDGMWSWRSKFNAWSGLNAAQQFVAPEGASKTAVDWEQWMRALGWDPTLREEAMAEIIHHCELDVLVLEEVYVRLVNANAVRSLRKDGGIL